MTCSSRLRDDGAGCVKSLDAANEPPILLQRAILGSLERFVGGLIERHGGKFPLWRAPVQVALMPLREEHAEYCKKLEARLQQELFRVDAMLEPAHGNKKIDQAQRARCRSC